MKWLLFCEIPTGLLGGMSILYASIYSYVAVTTPPKWRAMRLAIVELSMFASKIHFKKILIILNSF